MHNCKCFVYLNLTDTSMQIPATMVSSRHTPLWKKVAIGLWHMLTSQKVDQPCLLRSELGYLLLHAIDWRAEYRINVVLTFYCTGDKGHAWLTRNGRVFFLSDSMKVNSENLTVVGQTDKYIYYVKERNLQRWYAVDMPACRTGCYDT